MAITKVYLSVHDLAHNLPGLEYILKLKEHFDNFKITCFAIPEPNEDYRKKVGEKDQVDLVWAKLINSYDWMEVGVHGFDHSRNECDCTYSEMEKILEKAERTFALIELNYKKLFVAPYWKYSSESIQELNDNGYVIAYRGKPNLEIYRGYIHNWEVHQPTPDEDIIHGNGHLTNRGNKDSIGRKRVFDNIINSVPKDTAFGFISELYESKT